MADSSSLYHLVPTIYMEIKATQNDDSNVLFEMEASESKTCCSRHDVSYDLVIKDRICNVPLFCISGAEISNHPIKVYLSADSTIGTIEDQIITLADATAASISKISAENTYTAGDSTITIASSVITIQWTNNTLAEMKAMTIAFAIQCALTCHRLQPSHSLSDIYDSTRDVSSSEPKVKVHPIANKPRNDSVFETAEDVNILLRAVGWSASESKTIYYFGYSISDGQILLIAKDLYIPTVVYHQTVFDNQGNSVFSAKAEFKPDATTYHLTDNSGNIGKILHCRQSNAITLVSSQTTINAVKGEIGSTKYMDSSEALIANSKVYDDAIVELKIDQGLNSAERKLIFCTFLIQARILYKITYSIPSIFAVYLAICDCSRCQHSSSQTGVSQLLTTDKTYIRPAGYSSKTNLIYFEKFKEAGGAVLFTIECTPRKDLKGFVKLVAKDPWNETIFSAVHFSDRNILAFYSRQNNLLGYLWNSAILDRENRQIMSVVSVFQQPKNREDRYAELGRKFKILDKQGRMTAILSRNGSLVRIYRDYRRIQNTGTTPVELATITFFAIKIYCEVYKLENVPLPEITYRYKDANKDCCPLTNS